MRVPLEPRHVDFVTAMDATPVERSSPRPRPRPARPGRCHLRCSTPCSGKAGHARRSTFAKASSFAGEWENPGSRADPALLRARRGHSILRAARETISLRPLTVCSLQDIHLIKRVI
ncbi:hypothetical protein [Haematobacter massiliensis]|uniref:hypothetical protein n=1 Tax=Haematobacter massiliensis TaxID=195105 RepID=UPI003BFA2F14